MLCELDAKRAKDGHETFRPGVPVIQKDFISMDLVLQCKVEGEVFNALVVMNLHSGGIFVSLEVFDDVREPHRQSVKPATANVVVCQMGGGSALVLYNVNVVVENLFSVLLALELSHFVWLQSVYKTLFVILRMGIKGDKNTPKDNNMIVVQLSGHRQSYI